MLQTMLALACRAFQCVWKPSSRIFAGMAGNMWFARCDYIARLLRPTHFRALMDSVAPIPTCFNYFLGSGRFADEFWVLSHPAAIAVDVMPLRTIEGKPIRYGWAYYDLPQPEAWSPSPAKFPRPGLTALLFLNRHFLDMVRFLDIFFLSYFRSYIILVVLFNRSIMAFLCRCIAPTRHFAWFNTAQPTQSSTPSQSPPTTTLGAVALHQATFCSLRAFTAHGCGLPQTQERRRCPGWPHLHGASLSTQYACCPSAASLPHTQTLSKQALYIIEAEPEYQPAKEEGL